MFYNHNSDVNHLPMNPILYLQNKICNKVRLIWRKISVERTCINSLEPSAMPYSVNNFVNICWGNGMLPDGTKL